jgi:hypothetical protein
VLQGEDVKLYLVTSAVDGSELTSCPECFTPRKEAGYPLNGSVVRTFNVSLKIEIQGQCNYTVINVSLYVVNSMYRT